MFANKPKKNNECDQIRHTQIRMKHPRKRGPSQRNWSKQQINA